MKLCGNSNNPLNVNGTVRESSATRMFFFGWRL